MNEMGTFKFLKLEGKRNYNASVWWFKGEIEKKNFREPLINAPGLFAGNSLAYNWAKQSGK